MALTAPPPPVAPPVAPQVAPEARDLSRQPALRPRVTFAPQVAPEVPALAPAAAAVAPAPLAPQVAPSATALAPAPAAVVPEAPTGRKGRSKGRIEARMRIRRVTQPAPVPSAVPTSPDNVAGLMTAMLQQMSRDTGTVPTTEVAQQLAHLVNSLVSGQPPAVALAAAPPQQLPIEDYLTGAPPATQLLYRTEVRSDTMAPPIDPPAQQTPTAPESPGPQCGVCLGPLRDPEHAAQFATMALSRGHVYHTNCITRWANTKSEPVDRSCVFKCVPPVAPASQEHGGQIRSSIPAWFR